MEIKLPEQNAEPHLEWYKVIQSPGVYFIKRDVNNMPRHLKTWMSVYITSVDNILHGRCSIGKFSACMHMLCIYSQNTSVWRGEGLGLCV